MSHSEVAHRWFHQIGNRRTNENEYSSGNMFYENSLIFSYGYHYVLGALFDDKVILNTTSYSNSTSKHQNHVAGAVDRATHKRVYLPLKPWRAVPYFDRKDFKQWYKVINFKSFVVSFEEAVDKLGRARKPELYLSEINALQEQLTRIFKMFRGSKTYARKIKGIRAILRFSFDDATQEKLKKAAKEAQAKEREAREAREKELQKDLVEWIANKRYYVPFELKGTYIRVRGEEVQTSAGMRVPLSDALRVFKLWQAGKAVGVEIKTTNGVTWKCTAAKRNGIIKFGCHEIEKAHAEKVLEPYLAE